MVAVIAAATLLVPVITLSYIKQRLYHYGNMYICAPVRLHGIDDQQIDDDGFVGGCGDICGCTGGFCGTDNCASCLTLDLSKIQDVSHWRRR